MILFDSATTHHKQTEFRCSFSPTSTASTSDAASDPTRRRTNLNLILPRSLHNNAAPHGTQYELLLEVGLCRATGPICCGIGHGLEKCSSRSDTGESQPRTSGSLDEDCESTRNERPQLESRTSLSCAPKADGIQRPGVSDPYPECTGQEQGQEETLGPGEHPQHVPSCSRPATHTGENEEPVITSFENRVTYVALGLGRVPADFYARGAPQWP
ncbi:hypothetical protein OG21DRAFT_1035653 [Imleria badia]|nr:hypothetical protein OG21DRAFT_1035653 [Imleria badia]